MVIIKKMRAGTPREFVCAVAKVADAKAALEAEMSQTRVLESDLASALAGFEKIRKEVDDSFSAMRSEMKRVEGERAEARAAMGIRDSLKPKWDSYVYFEKTKRKDDRWLGEVPKNPNEVKVPEVRPVDGDVLKRYKGAIAKSLVVADLCCDAADAVRKNRIAVRNLERSLVESYEALHESRRVYRSEKAEEDRTTAEAAAEAEADRNAEIKELLDEKAEAENRLAELGVS